MGDIKIGQIWREVDPRFEHAPRRKVVGFADDGRVIIGFVDAVFSGRTTKAKSSRFNGKRGGYELIEDVE